MSLIFQKKKKIYIYVLNEVNMSTKLLKRLDENLKINLWHVRHVRG